MTVFDELDRLDGSPRRHGEATFHFLNRAAGEHWDQVRDVIEVWVTHYPEDGLSDLVGRLRSPIDRHSGAAWWELYLHESLIRSEYEVVVHPTVPGNRRPDFLAKRTDQSFYVEAKSLFGKISGSTARLNIFLDELNLVDSPNFFVGMDIRSVGPRALPTKKLRADLEQWLRGLDPDGVVPRAWIEESEERWAVTQEGWDIRFRPWPIRAGARGRRHNLVGSWNPNDGPAESASTIGASLRDKGTAYGELDHPLLLAFNLDSGFDRRFETSNALYGSAMVTFNRWQPNEARETRDTNGYWGYPGGWKHRHVVGILVGPNIGPWSAGSIAPTLWLHPSPIAPIEGLPHWHQTKFIGDRLVDVEAARLINQLFRLPDPWPIGEAFPRG